MKIQLLCQKIVINTKQLSQEKMLGIIYILELRGGGGNNKSNLVHTCTKASLGKPPTNIVP